MAPFPRQFPDLDTVRMVCQYHHLRDSGPMEYVTRFNAPSGQRVRRVEFHGPSSVLREGGEFLRKLLPAGIELVMIEITVPPELYHSWSI